MKNIGIFGSCQLYYTVNFFLNKKLLEDNNLNIKILLPFYVYDKKSPEYKEELNYDIFNDLDILIIENNNLNNQASSEKIINYCKNQNSKIQIIKTCLLKFPIYPINWSGYGENKNDYLNWNGLENINYVDKFNKILDSIEKEIYNTDLDNSIVEFIRNNFKKILLFTHSLHPTNILLYQLWEIILQKMNINITNYDSDYDLINKKEELIPTHWINPFTSKMVNDLNINFDCLINDEFYINRYKEKLNKFNNS
jgi:hypothetical protein